MLPGVQKSVVVVVVVVEVVVVVVGSAVVVVVVVVVGSAVVVVVGSAVVVVVVVGSAVVVVVVVASAVVVVVDVGSAVVVVVVGAAVVVVTGGRHRNGLPGLRGFVWHVRPGAQHGSPSGSQTTWFGTHVGVAVVVVVVVGSAVVEVVVVEVVVDVVVVVGAGVVVVVGPATQPRVALQTGVAPVQRVPQVRQLLTLPLETQVPPQQIRLAPHAVSFATAVKPQTPPAEQVARWHEFAAGCGQFAAEVHFGTQPPPFGASTSFGPQVGVPPVPQKLGGRQRSLVISPRELR